MRSGRGALPPKPIDSQSARSYARPVNEMSRLLNVVDVEATCWAGRASAGAVSEIIEIGLTVVDLDRVERVAKHRIPVRPVSLRVGEFCTELTGLTQEEVDTGLSFAEAR